MTLKLLIVGGVAGGATTAARARRLDESAEIILFERGEHISFANCGLPYYIGGTILQRNSLLVTTPDQLRTRFMIDVRIRHEVIDVDPVKKEITVRDLVKGEEYRERYDKLLLSPGAEPIRPPIPGIDLNSIFTIRNIPDTLRAEAFIRDRGPKTAVVVGGGYIGLEMVENLSDLGIQVTIIEMMDRVLPPFDPEMASIIQHHLLNRGVQLHLGDGVQSFREQAESTIVTTLSGAEFRADMIILAIGVRPENDLALKAGLSVGPRGGIMTDSTMRTTNPDIYAVGDAVQVMDFVTGQPSLIPLAGPANRQARIAADAMFGRNSTFRGTQGTAILKVFDLTAAATGNNEKQLKALGIPYRASCTHPPSHATYYPGAQGMAIKLLFSPEDGRILGTQIIGGEGVDKRIDVIATAIMGRMSVFDLEQLELAYAPPYSSAKDPVNMAGFVAANILRGDVGIVTWDEIPTLDPATHVLLDVREEIELRTIGMIQGALHIPIDELRQRLGELDRNITYVVYCAVGHRGYVACRILMHHGIQCANLSGGFTTYSYARS